MIPNQYKKPALVVSILLILYCVFWLFGRIFFHPSAAPPPAHHQTSEFDHALATVAAQEAIRLGDGKPSVILIFSGVEKGPESPTKQTQKAYLKGFQEGLKAEGAPPILSTVYKGSDPQMGGVYPILPWTALSRIASDSPSCNVIIAFDCYPQAQPDSTGTLPHLLVVANTGNSHRIWREMFHSGFVDVLITPRGPPGAANKDLRKWVESSCWILTKENLDASILKANSQ